MSARARRFRPAALFGLLVALFVLQPALESLAAASYPAEVLADAPRGYWRLGETSGTTAADLSGNNLPGTYQNGTILGVPGAIPDGNPAARFDGLDDRVNMADPASGALDFGTGDFTVEAWVRTGANGEQIIASKQIGTAGVPYWQVTVTDDFGHAGSVRAKLYDGTVTRQVYGPPVHVDDGAWHHLAVVFARASGITIYVDKIFVSQTAGAMAGDVSNTANFLVGGRTISSYPSWSGDIDEAAVYPSALTQARLAAHYDAVTAGETTPPSVTLTDPAPNAFVNDTTPTLAGTAGLAAGDRSEVKVKLYSGSLPSGTPVQTLSTFHDSAGAWAADASPALAQGTYTAQAEQLDAAGNTGLSAPVTFNVVQPPPPSSSDPVFSAAGDIADCGVNGDEQTATVLDGIPGTVGTLGDNAYESGTATEFTNCYDPTWGRHKARTRPAAGDHDYDTPGATGYFNYFGAAAGDPSKGYYSYDLGTWHVIVLNNNCTQIGGCIAGSPQEQWLRADLAANPSACTLSYFGSHLFSSGSRAGDNVDMKPLVQALYDYGADLMLTADDHDYERFAPQDPNGRLDLANGITEIVAGTGGRSHYLFNPASTAPNSQVRNDDTFGVVKLALHPAGYDWTFVPVAGKSFTDSGSRPCHHAGTGQIVVRENSVPDDAQDFAFTASGGLSPGTFTLDDDADPARTDTQNFANLTPGSGYSISQALPAGWASDGASCDDGSPPSNIDVASGETVTCTFTNQKTFYQRPAGAPSVQLSLVPVFRQCGTGGNAPSAAHPAPLSVGSCPPAPVSTIARVGASGAGSFAVAAVSGDFSITESTSDVRTPSGADYDPSPPGTPDLTAIVRVRVTDLANCAPAPCSGPFQTPATAVDADFGPIPIDCVPNGAAGTPPGSDCNLTTSANSFLPGFAAAQRQAVLQLFRVRVNDSSGGLFEQEGILAP